MASYYADILDHVITKVRALSLVSSSNVVKRKVPHSQDGLDTLPQIQVIPRSSPESVDPISFDSDQVVYGVDVVLIRSNKVDQSGEIDEQLDWRQQVRQTLDNPKTFSAASVFGVNFDLDPPIDRSAIDANYDVSALGILVSNIEDR